MRSRTGVVLAVLVTVLGIVAATILVRHAETGGPAAANAGVVLDQDFDGNTLDPEVWNTCHWWADGGCTIASNDELEWYRSDQVSLSDGSLRLTAQHKPLVAADGRTYDYRSGMVTTGPADSDSEAKVAITYGSVDVRFKAPAGRGLWPAIWLLPADRESRPEIDLLEMIGQDPSELILHLHPADRDADSPSQRVRLKGPDLADEWHTVGLTWTPGRLVYLLDREPVWTVTGSQVPDEPMYLVINLAVGGAYPGPPDESTPFPATFQIDHVRMTTGGLR